MVRWVALLPDMIIGGRRIRLPIQAGMGVGISLALLAAAIAWLGGLGVISCTCLPEILFWRDGKWRSFAEAVFEEVSLAKKMARGRGFIGVNLMVKARFFAEAARAAEEAGVDFIFAGAGMPMDLPSLLNRPKDIALVPIVSSGRALGLVCKNWRRKYNLLPAAVAVEGGLAGGHLGFEMEQIGNPESTLERILPGVFEVAQEFGGIPIIGAGGFFYHQDIEDFLNIKISGVSPAGVQVATRLYVCKESGASDRAKAMAIAARKRDIGIIKSPCGDLPLRVLLNSPALVTGGGERTECKGYLLDGKGWCRAKEKDSKYPCLCYRLSDTAGISKGPILVTLGANGWRLTEADAVPAKTIMDELQGG